MNFFLYKIIWLLAIFSSVVSAELEPMGFDDLGEATAGGGVTAVLDWNVSADYISYINDEAAGETHRVLINKPTLDVEFEGITLDLVNNYGGSSKTAAVVGLPDRVEFTNTGFDGLFITKSTTSVVSPNINGQGAYNADTSSRYLFGLNINGGLSAGGGVAVFSD